jgi:hypothetical protein
MAKKVAWTAADDYYLRRHAHKQDAAELAAAVGKTERQVEARLPELGLTPEALAEARRKKVLAGLQQKEGGPVVMTGGRSMADDAANGVGPAATKPPRKANSYLDQFKNNIHRGP